MVKARVDNQIQLLHYHTNLESMVKKKTAELTRTHERILETLASIIEYRSLESGTHIRRTSELTDIIAHELLNTEYKEQLETLDIHSMVKAVALHDIGKVGIPDSVLLKPGRLTDEEFEVVKTHPVIGGDIIDSISKNLTEENLYLDRCKEICRHHHERWDGQGYPDRLAGEDIPLSARILSVVDVYDALVNTRCYKPAFSYDEALDIVVQGAGTQFDPVVTAALVRVKDDFARLENEHKEND